MIQLPKEKKSLDSIWGPTPKIKDEELPKLRATLNGLQELTNLIQGKTEEIIEELRLSGKDEKDLEETRLIFSMCANMAKQFQSLSFISDPSVTSLDDNQQQDANLKFFGSVFSTASENRPLLDQKNLATIRDKFIANFSNVFISDMITDIDRGKLKEWFEEIVAIQKTFRPLLLPPTFEKGDSKGFLFRIKKNGEIRGWLFGTMHALQTKELINAANLSETVYQKLQQCAVLGTEIKLSKGSQGDSVENKLIQFARERGIINVGLDAKERDDGEDLEALVKARFAGVYIDILSDENSPHANKEMVESKKKITAIYDSMGRAYQAGNGVEFNKIVEDINSEGTDPSPIEEIRQAAMIKNIDASLRALEEVKREPHEEVPKGFFGVGTAHVICDKMYSQTIVEGLRQLNWDVEFDPQDEFFEV